MPGTNLTREEAATRAALLDVTSYSIDLDLTTGDKTFASTTTVRFTCREPGAETFADLVDAIVHEITLNGEPLDEAVVVPERPDRPDRPAGRERAGGPGRLRLLPLRRGPAPLRRPGRRPRLPLHAVRGARRPPRVHDVRAARPEVGVHLDRHRAGRLEGRLQRPDAGARGPRRREGPVELPRVEADVDVHHRADRRRVPRAPRHLRGQERHDPARPLLPAGAGRAPRHRRAAEDHQAGLRVLRGGLRLPLPVREVRPALRAGVQRGRDGERRCGHAPRRVPPPQPSGRRVLRVPLLGDPARDGAHVVRRPGDHEVVGRPLAERVVRRVGVLPRGRREHRVHRVLDRLHQRPQELGAAPGPAPLDPPDRGRQLRPARRRGQLRRHHLRQGRLGAQAAGRVGRARARSWSACGSTSRTTPTRTPSSSTCSPRWRRPRAASSTPGPRSGCRPAASTPSPPSSSSPPTAPTRRSASARPRAGDNATLRRHRIGIGLYDEVGGRLVRRRNVETDIEGDLTVDRRAGRRAAARPAAAQRRRPHLRQDPPRRAVAGHRRGRPAAARRLAGAGAVLGRRLGHDPRRRDDGVRLRHPGAGQHRDRDRRVRRPGASRTTPRTRSTSTPTRRAAPELRARWEAGVRELLHGRRARQRPPADLRPRCTPRPLRSEQARRRPRRAARRLAGRSRASTSTPTCAGRCWSGSPSAARPTTPRSTRSSSATTPSPARRTPRPRGPPVPTPTPRRAPGPSWWRTPTCPTRRTARSRHVHAVRPGGPARAVRREVPRGGRHHLGASSAPTWRRTRSRTCFPRPAGQPARWSSGSTAG